MRHLDAWLCDKHVGGNHHEVDMMWIAIRLCEGLGQGRYLG